jgi:hypothetical protein
MASLIKKTIRGKSYYYARECQRINGRPKIVWQKYLGKADDIVAALTQPLPAPEPGYAVVTEFGAVAALYDLAERLALAQHVDTHVPKRGAGPTVGTYLLVAILNRCLAPCSKAGIAEWFQDTALRRLLGIEARQLSSQRFWDNMDRVSSPAIAAIERDIVKEMVAAFALDLNQVLFDATNFFTFIDTFNQRNTLAQRGHSKEGRKALRIVGLALLVSADGHVPLLHRTYPGNQTDAPTFRSLTDALIARYRELCAGAEHVTLVFDKGNKQCRRQPGGDSRQPLPLHRFTGADAPHRVVGDCQKAVPLAARAGPARGQCLSHHPGDLRRAAHGAGDVQREPLRRPIAHLAA